MKKIVRCAEIVIVAAAIAVLSVRGIEGGAYDEYRRNGGRNGFAEWFAKEVCGVDLPGMTDYDEKAKSEQKERDRKRALRELTRQKKEAELAERRELARKEAAKRIEQSRKQQGKTAGAKKRKTAAGKKGRGGTVSTKGKSSYVRGDGRTPYRVNGIRGIEFGSSDNAPGEKVKPTMSVREREDGSMEFVGLRWAENRKLSDPIYGFDNAWLNHTYESEQLSSVTMHKSFPFTEEGMAKAVEFYKSMSSEASADLGFEIVDVDRTGSSNATIYEFRNSEGDTSIRGTISAWSDKNLTVTFSVSDKGYETESRAQANAAYKSGEADALDARIDVVNRDYSAQMERAAEYLNR